MVQDSEKTPEELKKENAELRSRLEELRALQSEIRRTQEESRESEDRFKIIFEYAPDAYYISDLKGTFLDGNKAAEELIGYKKDELVGKSFLKLDLLPVSFMAKAAGLLAQNALGRATGPDVFELKRQDGSRITVDISTYPVKIKDKTVVLGIARNIGKSIKMEEDFQELKKELGLVLNGVSEVVFRVNENGKILDVNAKVEEVFGHKQKAITGQNFFKLGFVTTKDSPKVARSFSEAIQGEELSPLEFESKKKDGTGLTVEAKISLIKREKTAEELLIIVRDVTKG